MKETELPNVDRLPPRSQEAERSVLGSILRDNQCYHLVAEILNGPEAFYEDAHQILYRAMCGLLENQRPVDTVTLFEELMRLGKVEASGGAVYVRGLYDDVPTAANAVHYANIVRDRWLLRSLVHVSTETLADAYTRRGAPEELIEQAQSRLSLLGQGRTGFDTLEAPALVELTDRDFENRMALEGDGITGIASGWADLDDFTCGFQNGEIIYIAARPGCGKTTTGAQCVMYAAVTLGIPSLFVSIEQAKSELFTRMRCCLGRVNSQNVRKGRPTGDDVDRWNEAGHTLRQAPLAIDHTHGISLAGIKALARQRKRKNLLSFMAVDYIGLIEPENRRDNRAEQIAQISRGLKLLAQELNIPILVLAQINRQAENRESRKPRLADLKDSGSQEADADVVLLLHPEEVHGVLVMNVEVAKQRNGPTGEFKLACLPQFLRYENYASTPFSGGV